MNIQVKHTLTKSRNPTEYNLKLENKKGELIQVVGDGYCLIEFSDLLINKQVKVNTHKVTKKEKLQWYIHEEDFFIDQSALVNKFK